MKLPENTDTFRQAQIQLKQNDGSGNTFKILGHTNIPVGQGAEWFKVEADFTVQTEDIDVATIIGGYVGDYFMDHFYIGPAAAIAPCRQRDVTIDSIITTTGQDLKLNMKKFTVPVKIFNFFVFWFRPLAKAGPTTTTEGDGSSFSCDADSCTLTLADGTGFKECAQN